MKAEPRIVPAVSRVSGETIAEIIYDGRTTAFAVSRAGEITIEDTLDLSGGDRLVPYGPTNNLIRHECVLLPAGPVDHGGKEQLLSDIEAYLHRYVDLSVGFERVAAHYVLMTWVFDAFNEVPYLRFKGDYGSGKTRALIALGSICYKGFFASAASTVSPIFHTLDRFGGTLILDEADLRFSDKTADLVKILNNGTVQGLPVLRTLQNAQKEFSPAAFAVFGPKIVAMRGSFRDDALESRFITEEMGTRPLRADIPIELPKSLKTHALALRNRLLHFRLTNLFTIGSNPSRLIEGIDPRLNQTALSLLSLVDDASVREDIANGLRERQVKISAVRARGIEARTLSSLESLAQRVPGSVIPLQAIAQEINDDEFAVPVSAREIGTVLRAHSLPLHKSNGRVGVPKSALRAAASIRNPLSGGPETAPPKRAVPRRN